jgi:hypothetical protein
MRRRPRTADSRMWCRRRVELERFCFLDEADLRLVGMRRGDHNRLGFALQLVTVRALGTFLADPLGVPPGVLDYVAQVDVADPSGLKRYVEREKTRLEHQWEIARDYGYRDFADAEPELVRWIADRCWHTGDGRKMIFDSALAWLRERRVLLPGVSTLARLVCDTADQRWGRRWPLC